MLKNLNFHVSEELRERFRFLASCLGVSQVDLFVSIFEYFWNEFKERPNVFGVIQNAQKNG